MLRYDPDRNPAPEEWLSLDEGERIQLVEAFHARAKEKLQNVRLHAALHAAIENQIALNHPPVARAMERLRQQGRSRHDSVHAIASVLAQHFYAITVGTSSSALTADPASYDNAVDQLTAAQWLETAAE